MLPASPAFYAGATHIQDLVDFVAGRVLDAAGVPHQLYRRWEGELGGALPERARGVSASCLPCAAARGAVDAVGGGGLVGTRAVGQVLQLAHPGVGHLDRVHGVFTPEDSIALIVG